MIAVIASTNRPDSVSLKVAKFYAAELKKLGQTVQIVDLAKLPEDFAFSALYANSGKNEHFNVYREVMNEAEKFLFVIPEYNGSFPGVLKTFIDGLEFPSSLAGKFATLTGISSGTQGSALAMSHFSDILNYLGCHLLATRPRVIGIESAFDGDAFTQAAVKELVEVQLKNLVAI